jgi:hypothetical protein
MEHLHDNIDTAWLELTAGDITRLDSVSPAPAT